MDDLEYLEDEQIKTHKEIVRMLQDLEEYEQQIEQPEITEPIESEPEFIEVLESEQQTDQLHDKEIVQPPKYEPELRKEKNKFFPLSHEKPRKVPKALVKTSRVRTLLFERKKHKPHDVVISKKNAGKRRLFRTSITSRVPRSTFTLRLDSNGHLLGFFTQPPHLKKEQVEKKEKHHFFKKKKQGKETQEKSIEPAKGFKGKIKKLIPHRKSKDKTEGKESGGSKIKKLLPRRKKTKE